MIWCRFPNFPYVITRGYATDSIINYVGLENHVYLQNVYDWTWVGSIQQANTYPTIDAALEASKKMKCGEGKTLYYYITEGSFPMLINIAMKMGNRAFFMYGYKNEKND